MALITTALGRGFIDLSYHYPQEAMIVDRSRSFAEMYDSAFSDEGFEEYRSSFGTFGGRMLDVAMEAVGPEEMLARSAQLSVYDATPVRVDVPYDPTPHVRRSIATQGADYLIAHFLRVFPELKPESMVPFRPWLIDHYDGFLDAEIRGVQLHSPEGETLPWTESRRLLVVKVLDDYLSHLAYLPVHKAMNIGSGDVASLFDSESTGPYEGLFANTTGGQMVETIIRFHGEKELLERQAQLFPSMNDIEIAPFPDNGDETDVARLATDATKIILDHVRKVFPAVEEEALERFVESLTALQQNYIIHELPYRADRSAVPAL